MADQDQVARLRQGVKGWNIWRSDNPKAACDLTKADLTGVDLIGADLTKADLTGADLPRVNLSYASLSEANLFGADLTRADLTRADLVGSSLFGANLTEANLTEANLTEADLSYANLSDADLSRANLTEANLTRVAVKWTRFTAVSLQFVKGLETVDHVGPSSVGIDTLYLSQGQIPESFLRKAGIPEDFLTYLPSLVNRALEYYTCFISYANQNTDFVQRLYADLQTKGVRCWYAPEDMKIGDKIRQRIDESIHLHDKLLLVLSEQSVASPWVEFEVEAALERERLENRIVLFPIRLDEQVMLSPTAWAADIRRSRHIGNFTHWKEHDSYQRGLQRLLRDLQPDRPRERKSPQR